MSKLVFKLDKAGVRAMLQSEMIKPVIDKAAKKIADGSNTKAFVGFDRYKVIAYPDKER